MSVNITRKLIQSFQIVVLLIFSFSAQAATLTCESIFQITAREFTSPLMHNSQEFQYLVHSIDIPLSKGLTVDQVHNYLTTELATNSQKYLSTSLIDEKHPGTFGRFGFILSIPESSIVAAKPSDMGTSLFASGARSAELINTLIDYFKSKFPMSTAEELLSATDPQSYNEILISGKGLKIIALFKKKVSPQEDQQLSDFANQNQLPLIQLQDVP